jgi:hypothetical protein
LLSSTGSQTNSFGQAYRPQPNFGAATCRGRCLTTARAYQAQSQTDPNRPAHRPTPTVRDRRLRSAQPVGR